MPQIASTRSLIYKGNKSGDLEVLECIFKMIFDIYLKVYVINHTATLAAVFECYSYNLNQIACTDCYHTFALTIERFTPYQAELINVIVLHFNFFTLACKDKSTSFCKRFASACGIKLNHETMKRYCPQSCGYCRPDVHNHGEGFEVAHDNVPS